MCFCFSSPWLLSHCLKTVQIRSFFWSVFGQFSRSDGLINKLRYTYGVRGNCLIFKTPYPLSPFHLRPKFFHPLDLGRPVLSDTSPTLSNKLSNNNRTVHVNKQNQKKNKTESRHIKLTTRSVV